MYLKDQFVEHGAELVRIKLYFEMANFGKGLRAGGYSTQAAVFKIVLNIVICSPVKDQQEKYQFSN